MGKKPCKRKLTNLSDCRVFLADLINRANRDEVDPSTATKLGYLVSVLQRVIENGQLEGRVKALEENNEGNTSQTSEKIRAIS